MRGMFVLAFFAIAILSAFIVNAQLTGDFINARVSALPTNVSLAIDSLPPVLILVHPQNITYSINNISLNYSAYDSGVGLDNVWYNVDNGANKTLTGNTTILVSDMSSHTLTLYANDSFGHVGRTSVTFSVQTGLGWLVQTTKYNGTTTNWTYWYYQGKAPMANLTNVTLEITQYGKVVFNEPINISRDILNLDDYSGIFTSQSPSTASFYIDANNLPEFNKSATVWFYNLSFSSPQLLLNGASCPISICTGISYSNGTFMFNTTFAGGVYTLSEPAAPSPPGGGGGGTTTPPVVQKEDFLVSPAEIKVSLKQGEKKQLAIIITNLENYAFALSLSSNELGGLMKITSSQTVLGAGELKAIYLDFSASESTNPDTYIRHLIIKGPNTEKDVLVTIDVQSKKVLLDVIATIPQESLIVAPGQELSAEIKFYNLGEDSARDVLAEYMIRDENGNVVYAFNETLVITKEETLLKKITIPKHLEIGKYIFSVRATYAEKISTSSVIFTLGKKSALSKEAIYLLIAALVLLIAVLWALIRRISTLLAGKRESLYSLDRAFNRRALRWAGARLYIERGYRRTKIYFEPKGSTIFLFIEGFKEDGKAIPVGAVSNRRIKIFFKVLSKGEISKENYKILRDINNATISGTKVLVNGERAIRMHRRKHKIFKRHK